MLYSHVDTQWILFQKFFNLWRTLSQNLNTAHLCSPLGTSVPKPRDFALQFKVLNPPVANTRKRRGIGTVYRIPLSSRPVDLRELAPLGWSLGWKWMAVIDFLRLRTFKVSWKIAVGSRLVEGACAAQEATVRRNRISHSNDDRLIITYFSTRTLRRIETLKYCRIPVPHWFAYLLISRTGHPSIRERRVRINPLSCPNDQLQIVSRTIWPICHDRTRPV